MTWIDYTVFGVCVVSVAWGIWRGVVREVMSLAGWMIAFLVANLFAGPAAAFVPFGGQHRVLIAFVALFVLSLVVTSIAALLLSKMAKAVGLGAVDRMVGALFGLARALIVVLAFALVAGLTALPASTAWKESLTGPYLGMVAAALKEWLPPAFADRLKYN